MDLFVPIVIIIIFFIFFSICGWCCKRHREGTVYGFNGAPVTVTNQPVGTTNVVQPPYPISSTGHPMPQQNVIQPPPPGFAAGYQNTPYPPSTAPGFYYPSPNMPVGGSPYPAAMPYPVVGGTPYPPANSGYHQPTPPPSYTEAVGQPAMPQAPPPTNELYAKQAPYNPNF